METKAMRPITINLEALETSNYFCTYCGEEADAQARAQWVAGMERIAQRDGVTLIMSNAPAMHGFSVDLDDNEDRYDTPEYSWFDRASDEAWSVGAAPNA